MLSYWQVQYDWIAADVELLDFGATKKLLKMLSASEL
jgi:hypothetical protein